MRAPAADAPLPPIPPEVEAKLEAARRAVAEAIVAAQDAGLVQTTVDPPPILDILITGRAIDERAVQARTGVSPEVFGAWFTGYGKLEGFTAQKDVRIIQPTPGLKQLYDQRANILNRHIEAVRKAKGPAPAPKAEEPKKEEPKTRSRRKTPRPKSPRRKSPSPSPQGRRAQEGRGQEGRGQAQGRRAQGRGAQEGRGQARGPQGRGAQEAEEPKAEEPKPEAPKAEEPKAEEPK